MGKGERAIIVNYAQPKILYWQFKNLYTGWIVFHQHLGEMALLAPGASPSGPTPTPWALGAPPARATVARGLEQRAVSAHTSAPGGYLQRLHARHLCTPSTTSGTRP